MIDGLTARTEIHQADGELVTGYVVRVYDGENAAIFDSFESFGSEGLFGSEEEAEPYRVARLAAERERLRQVAHERSVRPGVAIGMQGDHIAARERHLDSMRVANRARTAIGRAIEVLTDEAHDPKVVVDCAPRGKGWRVLASPALIDGAELVDGKAHGEPRLLASSGSGPVAPESSAVVDSDGHALKVGDEVYVPDDEGGEMLGSVVSLTSGSGMIDVEFVGSGAVLSCDPLECAIVGG